MSEDSVIIKEGIYFIHIWDLINHKDSFIQTRAKAVLHFKDKIDDDEISEMLRLILSDLDDCFLPPLVEKEEPDPRSKEGEFFRMAEEQDDKINAMKYEEMLDDARRIIEEKKGYDESHIQFLYRCMLEIYKTENLEIYPLIAGFYSNILIFIDDD